jgi:hypothetical protein
MPFKSTAQEKAAFAGYLGPTMKAHASEWAAETPSQAKLPQHVSASRKGLKRAAGGK